MTVKKNIILLLLLCIMNVTSGVAQTDSRLLPDSIVDAYLDAEQANAGKDYLKSFRCFMSLDRQVTAIMHDAGKTSADLSEDEFLFPYWRIRQGVAETAYMLGQYCEMQRIESLLSSDLAQRSFADDDVRKAYEAELLKIRGDIYYLTGDYERCAENLSAALQGNADLEFRNAVHGDLAQLYYKTGDYAMAVSHLDSILLGGRYGETARVRGDEASRMELLSQKAICLARLAQYGEAEKMIEDVIAFFRRKNDARHVAEALRKAAKIYALRYECEGTFSDRIVRYYREYLSMAKTYVDTHFVKMSASEREQYWMAEQQFITDCYRIEHHDPALLYDVTLYSKAILLQMGHAFGNTASVEEKRRSLAAIRTSWQEVKAAMPAASAAIEFITYDKAGANRLGAVVLNKASATPVFVEIGRLDSILAIPLAEGMTVGEAIASAEPADKNPLYADKCLSERIWNAKMLSAIGKAQNVYFAADGVLHILAIEYLLPETLRGRNVCRLTTTRRLATRHAKVRTASMLACGGIDYKTSENTGDADDMNDDLAFANMSAVGPGLPYLYGSKAEVDSLHAIRGANPADTILCGVHASEKALRELLGKYHIVHVATHGYFTEASTAGTDIRPLTSDEQLSKNCLFLSGAERNMHNPNFNPASLDGILSARELADMNLSMTDLMVLSACQTGLGFVTPDGVAGLQRGLKAAGVNALVVSLWTVDDKATAILMKALLSNLDKGMELTDAFREARQHLMTTETQKRIKRRGELPDIVVKKKYDKPQYHDAFILIDGY